MTLRAAGFSSINVDLIYAIPGQSLASWAASLDAAVALGTTHLSCYGLTYEPNKPMAVKKRLGAFQGTEETLGVAVAAAHSAAAHSAAASAEQVSMVSFSLVLEKSCAADRQ